MRRFIIPALCAIAMFGTATISFADELEERQNLSAAEITMDGTHQTFTDTMADDPSSVNIQTY